MNELWLALHQYISVMFVAVRVEIWRYVCVVKEDERASSYKFHETSTANQNCQQCPNHVIGS